MGKPARAGVGRAEARPRRHQRRESGGERGRSRDARWDHGPGARPGGHGHTAGRHPGRAHQHQSGHRHRAQCGQPGGDHNARDELSGSGDGTGNVLNQTGVLPNAPGTVTPGTVNPGTQYAPGTVIPGTPNATTYSSNYYAPGTQARDQSRLGHGRDARIRRPGDAGHGRLQLRQPDGDHDGAGLLLCRHRRDALCRRVRTPGYYTRRAADLHRPAAQRPLRGYLRPPESRRLSRQSLRDDLYPTPYGYTTTGLQHLTTPGTYTYSTSPY